MKKKMRKSILTRRKSMTQGEVDSLSKMICQRIIDYHFLEDITDVCLYMPIQNEVNLSELISILHNNNKTVWLPRIFSDKMDFFLFDKNTALIEGAYHILEPDNLTKLYPNPNTLIIVPGAVFSINGDRIGYGGGYYDRYMEAYPNCQYLAVCYDYQVLEKIPYEQHDRRPNVILTEQRIFYIS